MQNIFYEKWGWLLWKQLRSKKVKKLTFILTRYSPLPIDLCRIICHYSLMPEPSKEDVLNIRGISYSNKIDNQMLTGRLYFKLSGVILDQVTNQVTDQFTNQTFFTPIFDYSMEG